MWSNVMLYYCFIFFVKQATAFEMRISDGSSDVCSSDLAIKLMRHFACVTSMSLIASLQTMHAAVSSVKRGSFTKPSSTKASSTLAISSPTGSSEERRGGKECVSPGSSRWSPYPEKKNRANNSTTYTTSRMHQSSA